MPKLGRRQEIAELEYQWRENMTTQLAPFGTHDTPSMRTKIVGGKPVMVAEDRNYAAKKHQTIEDLSPPGPSPRRRVSGGETSPRLAPLTEKPNYFDPSPFVAGNNKRNSHVGYDNSQQDLSSRSTMNPHPVVPPIAPGGDQAHYSTPSDASMTSQRNAGPRAPHDLTDMLRHLPRDQFLPRAPVSYPTREELELRRRVHSDLKGYDPKRFKDTYTELAGYDRQLTGYINMQDMAFTLSRNQINLNALHLRLVAAMFVSPTEVGKVNYEKLLSFLAASQRDAASVPAGGPTTDPNSHLEEERELAAEGVRYNFITHRHEDFSPRSQKYPYQDRDNAKLLRYLEEQLSDSVEDLDMEKCWNAFSRADREKRGTLSENQIKDLIYSLGIPLQSSLINAIIEKCDYTNGQIRWEQFLEFINRVAPRKTGLKIPESKKPTEYVKHYPVPGTNWPKGDWDNTEYGIPRNKQRPLPPHGRPPSPPNQRLDDVMNPNDLLEQFNPRQQQLEDLEARTRRQTENDRLQRDIDRLEEDYQPRQRRRDPPRSSNTEPWFNRFMKLANALYEQDSDNIGKVKTQGLRRFIDDYNWELNLDLPEAEVNSILRKHTHGNEVSLDPILREIGLLGPGE